MADVLGAIKKKVFGDIDKQVGDAVESGLQQAPVFNDLVDYEPVELEIGPIVIPAFKVPIKFNRVSK